MLVESSLPDLVKMALARPQSGWNRVPSAVEHVCPHGLGHYAQKQGSPFKVQCGYCIDDGLAI